MILFKSQARFAVMLSFVEENGGAKRAGGARSGEPAGRRVLPGRSRPRAHSNLNDGEIEPAPRAAGTGRRVPLGLRGHTNGTGAKVLKTQTQSAAHSSRPGVLGSAGGTMGFGLPAGQPPERSEAIST